MIPWKDKASGGMYYNMSNVQKRTLVQRLELMDFGLFFNFIYLLCNTLKYLLTYIKPPELPSRPEPSRLGSFNPRTFPRREPVRDLTDSKTLSCILKRREVICALDFFEKNQTHVKINIVRRKD